MDRNYHSNGHRTIDFTLYKSAINQLRKDWKNYVKTIPEYPGGFSERGIVMCAGGLSYFTCAYVSLKALRRTGCSLPVELWYVGNELSEDAKKALKGWNVEFRNFLDYPDAPMYGYRLKPYAILHSRFKEILFLDSDNICVRNPEELFHTKEYNDYGAIFWPDYWKTPKENPIWGIVGSTDYEIKEQESGQIIINKERCWRALNLCQYFNIKSNVYYRLLLGDKDTFKFAWMALKTPFHMIRTELGSGGYTNIETGDFHGITMVQHNPAGEICFLHRNLLKWDITKPHEFVWEKIKRFLPDASVKEYYIETSDANGHLYTDLKGDIEELDFKEIFDDLEEICLADLDELRHSQWYTRFMIHLHLGSHRYRKDMPFSLKFTTKNYVKMTN